MLYYATFWKAFVSRGGVIKCACYVLPPFGGCHVQGVVAGASLCKGC